MNPLMQEELSQNNPHLEWFSARVKWYLFAFIGCVLLIFESFGLDDFIYKISQIVYWVFIFWTTISPFILIGVCISILRHHTIVTHILNNIIGSPEQSDGDNFATLHGSIEPSNRETQEVKKFIFWSFVLSLICIFLLYKRYL